MNRVCRVCLFFCVGMLLFGCGVYSHVCYRHWLDRENQQRRGRQEQTIEKQKVVSEESQTDLPTVHEAMNGEVRTTADTRLEIRSYDIRHATAKQEMAVLPGKYIGMTRKQFEEALEDYKKAPPLRELNRGFTDMKLLTFSEGKVLVEKSYYLPDPSEQYVLAVENNYITVYFADEEEVYLYTDIRLDSLPEDLQEEIILRKSISSESELYNFLESYSS